MNTRSGRIQIRTAQPADLSVMQSIRRDAILGIRSDLDANVRQAWADRRSADFYSERVALRWSVYLRVAGVAVLEVAAAVEKKAQLLRGPERMFYGLVEVEV